MLLDFRKPECSIVSKCVSWSGKYMGFYGFHYHKGKPCWVVGSSNKQNGEIVMRHYNADNNPDERIAKHEAEHYWQEFRAGLLKKPEYEETDEQHEELMRWFDEAERQANRRKKRTFIN